MDAARNSHWWLGRFAARLLQLNPTASAPSVIRRAVANYDRAVDLEPELAADLYYRKVLSADFTRRPVEADTRAPERNGRAVSIGRAQGKY